MLTDEQFKAIFHSEHCNISADLAGILGRAIEAAVQQPVADLMCQWKGGKISGDELADRLFSLFASSPSSAVLEAQKGQKPVAWAYTINNSHSVFSAEKPPEDAYDEGTLYPLFAAPVVQPDRVLVPREPTEAMLDAAMNRYHHVSPEAKARYTQMHRENFRWDYRAMIAAAEGK